MDETTPRKQPLDFKVSDENSYKYSGPGSFI